MRRLPGFTCAGVLLAVTLVAAPAVADGTPQAFEGEALAGRARATQGRVAAQDMRRFGDAWSGGAHLSWASPTGGQRLYLLLPVDRAGEYEFAITYTRAMNHADFTVAVGGTQRGPVQPGFASAPVTSGRVSLGRVALRAGPNEVVITGTGKDTRSQGYAVGIDRFDVTPVGAGPESLTPLVRPSGTVFRPGERTPPPAVRAPPDDLHALVRPWTRAIAGWRGQARSVSPTLEVEQRATLGAEYPAVYGTDLLVDVDHLDGMERPFRWSHQLPSATSAVWQVARFEPAPMAKGWRTPAGLVAEGKVPTLPRASTPGAFPIDFRALPTPPARRFGSPERVFWVRVVCLDAQGEILAFPSNAVRVRFGPTPPLQPEDAGHVPAPSPWVEASSARVRILEYQPIRWEAADSHKRWVVSGPFPLGAWGAGQNAYPFGPVGAKLYISGDQEDDDLWQTISGALGDLVTYFVDAVNWVSKAHEPIKSAASDVAGSLVPDCDPACRNVLAVSLDNGLAAVGLPPDIPDFHALLALSRNHLVDMLVADGLAQGVAVLEPTLREAANRLVDEVERRAKQTADRGPSGTAWLKPDPDFQYRPAYVRVEVVNPGKEVLRPRLSVRVLGPPGGWLFKHAHQILPPLQPGERKELTVFLEHDPWAWVERDTSEHWGLASSGRARDTWWAAYQGPCALIVAVEAEITNPADGAKDPGRAAHVVEQTADQVFRGK